MFRSREGSCDAPPGVKAGTNVAGTEVVAVGIVVAVVVNVAGTAVGTVGIVGAMVAVGATLETST